MPHPSKKTDKNPVVRFAPSPTGFLHIGGARTALFNWLYAKAKGGTFRLRIEDTDRERNNPDAVGAILDGLRWLGLDWDGEPLSQYARFERHREVAEALLDAGHAYRCYLSAGELEEMRRRAEAERRSLVIHSPWRDRDPSEAPEGQPSTIRLKVPRNGDTVIADQVQGRVTFANKDLDDLIIVRSDGSPTYNLAVVTDDHDMGITHIIRGVDHLTNAARQTHIYKAMQWDVPVWAHVPLIHGSDGAKLSKRHGALGVEAYRALGYLPAALRNYLVRLGWSHGDDEIMSMEQLIVWFDLDGLGKSPARFDKAKLEDLNAHYIRTTGDSELIAHVRRMLPEIAGGKDIARRLDLGDGWLKFERALPGLKPRAKTLPELVDGAHFLITARPLGLDPPAAKLLDQDARHRIATLLESLKGVDPWKAESLEQSVREFADKTGTQLGKVAQPLRAALTGRTVSPPIFDVMAVLGRGETLARLEDQTND